MLYVLPIIFVLIGLVLYGVLGGADFGAGFWQLTAGRGEQGARVRDHAHHSMAPVWEANHVWLIFVLTVTWTAYPKAFGSIASTLSVALLLAGIGIIFRGAAYALRTGAGPRQERVIDTVFGISSVVAPFALGAAIGGVASGRVPVGNAAGKLFGSWLNPTSILIGALAVVTGAYMAAVFMSGDAEREGKADLAEAFRLRALGSGVVAGGVAIAGFIVLHGDAHHLYRGLISTRALPAVIVSILAGTTTLGLVWWRRYELARLSSAVAVAAIVAGWALAQSPEFLPGLTVRQAAAPHDTEVCVVVAVLAGGALLLPALATLFRLTLGGHLGESVPLAPGSPAPPSAWTPAPARPALLLRAAGALLIGGFGFVNVANAEWAHLVGAVCYLLFVVAAFRLAVPLPEPVRRPGGQS